MVKNCQSHNRTGRKERSSRLRRIGAGAALGVAVVAGGLGIASGSPSQADSAGPGSPPPAYASVGQVPTSGSTPVMDNTGQVRGYLDNADQAQALETGVDPVLRLGSGKIAVRGFPVRDRSGSVTGYLVVPGGFVDRATAEKPEAMDALMEKKQAEQAKYQPLMDDMKADLRNQTEGH